MTQTKKDITDIADIQLLVNSFYERVREDELIGHVFNTVIEDRWPEHLEKMYRFWQTVLLGVHTYNGSPFGPHAQLPVGQIHFERWMLIFTLTVDELFEGEKAEEAKWRAAKMAEMFRFKIEFYQGRNTKPLQ
jgi:hemoglobin